MTASPLEPSGSPAWVDVLLGATTAVCGLTLVSWLLFLPIGGFAAAGPHRSLLRTLLVWGIMLYPVVVPALIVAAWEFSLRRPWLAAALGLCALSFAAAIWIPLVQVLLHVA